MKTSTIPPVYYCPMCFRILDRSVLICECGHDVVDYRSKKREIKLTPFMRNKIWWSFQTNLIPQNIQTKIFKKKADIHRITVLRELQKSVQKLSDIIYAATGNRNAVTLTIESDGDMIIHKQ